MTQKNSLSVSTGNDGCILLNCFAGCETATILERIGLKMPDLFPVKSELDAVPGKPAITHLYDYSDETGKLLFQCVRYTPKNFRQRRPDGVGGWIWDLKGVRRVLYRLPELLAAVKSGEYVFFVEGEKDVDNLVRLGLHATCNPMGAVKWNDQYSEQARGVRAVILRDNDDSGIKHVAQLIDSLRKTATSLVTVELPDLPPKGDVSDWIAAGGTKDGLLALVAFAETAPQPDYDVLVNASQKNTTVAKLGLLGEPELRPLHPGGIETNNRQLAAKGADALGALAAKNDPPRLFVRAGLLARIQCDERGAPRIASLCRDAVQGELARAADWISTSEKRGAVNVAPPLDVCAYVLHAPDYPDEIPPLAGIVHAPTFAPDGDAPPRTGLPRGDSPVVSRRRLAPNPRHHADPG